MVSGFHQIKVRMQKGPGVPGLAGYGIKTAAVIDKQETSRGRYAI
jgi:hypothetical protein